jgi:hypothetical protein
LHSSDDEWRILAEKATHEDDPIKLLDTVIALNRALKEAKERGTAATDQS